MSELAEDVDVNEDSVIKEDLITEDEENPQSTEETEGETEEESPKEDQDGQVVVTIGEEAPPTDQEDEAKKSGFVNDLRKRYRELERENRQLKEAQTQIQPAQATELGMKPTLDEVNYDTDEYEKRLADWYQKKWQLDEKAARAKLEQEQANAAFSQRVAFYNEKKAKLQGKVSNYEDAEYEVVRDFDKTQQGLLIDCSKDPALMAYALGKNPAKRKELASIKSYQKFAYELGALETQLKVTPKRSAPPPEGRVKSGSASFGGGDAKLEALRKQSEKTGDITPVVEYKRALRKK